MTKFHGCMDVSHYKIYAIYIYIHIHIYYIYMYMYTYIYVYMYFSFPPFFSENDKPHFIRANSLVPAVRFNCKQ